MRKRYLLPLMLIPVLLTSCSKNDNSEVQEAGKTNFEFAIDDSSNAVLTGYHGNSKSITIPNQYVLNGVTYNVFKIADNAFENCTKLESVTIPQMIMSIGKDAFKNTKILNDQADSTNKYVDGWLIEGTSVEKKTRGIASYALSNFQGELVINKEDITLDSENDMFSISDAAFKGSSITSFKSDTNYNYIGKQAFMNTTLEEFETTGYLPYVSDYSFANSNLSSCVLSNDAWLIGQFAFLDTNITSINLGANVTYVSVGAFEDCSYLEDVTFANPSAQIAARAFKNASSLKNITLPSNLTSISSEMFYGCLSLKSIDIPSNVSSILGHAFYNCRSLTNIEIPTNVKNISQLTFAECINLEYVILPIGNANGFLNIDEDAFKSDTKLSYIYYKGNQTTIEDLSLIYDKYFSEDNIYYYSESFEEEGKLWRYNSEGVIERYVS